MAQRDSFPLLDISNPGSRPRSAGSPVSPVDEEDADNIPNYTKESKASQKCRLTVSEADLEPPKQPISIFDQLFTNWWGFEILGWLCATLMLVVLISILAVFDGKAIGEWKSGLSLNTIIQVVTQVAQMSIIVPLSAGIGQLKWLWYHNEKRPLKDMWYFEEASRGKFGSFMLLWNQRASLIVWLAIIALVLQILLGPFAQQAVQTPTRQINRGTGSIGRSTAYRASGYDDDQVLPNYGPDNGNEFIFGSVDPRMKAAITSAIGGNSVTISDVQGSCTTGNCTFGKYNTMGVCASVEDVTPTLISHCPKNEDVTRAGCSYTVPELQVHPPFPRSNYSSIVESESSKGLQKMTLFIGASQTIQASAYSRNNTLSEFYVIYLSDLSVLSVDSKENYTSKLVVLKGALDLCVLTYNSSMLEGVTTTTQLSQITDSNWTSNVVVENNDSHSILSTTVPGDTDTYSMTEVDITTFNNYLGSSIFTGFANMDPADMAEFLNEVTSTVAIKLYGSQNGTVALNGQQDLLDLLNSVAAGITNSLRTTSTVPSEITVPAYAFEIYFSVAWAWLAAPIASIPLTIIFLVLVIVNTRRAEIPAWKSSPLASLQAFRGLRAVAEMEARVNEKNEGGGFVKQVKLERLARGEWGLVEEWEEKSAAQSLER